MPQDQHRSPESSYPIRCRWCDRIAPFGFCQASQRETSSSHFKQRHGAQPSCTDLDDMFENMLIQVIDAPWCEHDPDETEYPS